MMQVNDVNKIKETTSSRIKKTSSSGDFSAYLKDVIKTAPEAVSGVGAVNVTDAIFAAQMVGEEEERELRKKQVERGKSLLEKLEEIRDGLLKGYLSKDRLMNIAQFVHERKMEAQDDRLNDIIEEIELRVEVELAKLMK